jgi:hypothetical protein
MNFLPVLALTYMFNAAFIPFDSYGYQERHTSYDNANSIEFRLGLDICNVVEIYGGEASCQTPAGGLSFSPYKQLYYVGAEAHYTVNDKLTIKAGIIRDCYHPVNAWGKTDGKVDGASLKIYVTASGKIPIW